MPKVGTFPGRFGTYLPYLTLLTTRVWSGRRKARSEDGGGQRERQVLDRYLTQTGRKCARYARFVSIATSWADRGAEEKKAG